MFKKILLKLYSPIIRKLNIISVKSDKPDYLKLIDRAYNAGYNYHQKLLKNDPEMIKWITKEHYLDKE